MELCKILYFTILYCNVVYMFNSISVGFFVDLLIKCNLNTTVLYHFEWFNIVNTYFRPLIITYILFIHYMQPYSVISYQVMILLYLILLHYISQIYQIPETCIILLIDVYTT